MITIIKWIKEEKKYIIYPYKVRYKLHGELKEDYALPNKDWWTKTCLKHDFLEFIEFYEIEITKDMLKRFEEIKNYDLYDFAVDYVEGKYIEPEIKSILLGEKTIQEVIENESI